MNPYIEIVLLVVEIALKAASLAINMILCTILAFMDAEWILDSDNIIVPKKFFTWIWTVKLIRIYELTVGPRKLDPGLKPPGFKLRTQ